MLIQLTDVLLCFEHTNKQAGAFLNWIVLKIADDVKMKSRLGEVLKKGLFLICINQNEFNVLVSVYIDLGLSFPWFRGLWCCYFTTELNPCHGDRCSWEVKQKFASVVNLSAVLWSLLSQCLIKLHTRSKQMKKWCCSSQITFKVTISSQVKSTWGNQFTAEAETLSIILHCVKALL